MIAARGRGRRMISKDELRILIVEDDFFIATDLEQSLRQMGYEEVQIAGSLHDGHQQMIAMKPHVAILDVHLGTALVFPLAADLSSRGVNIIFSTSMSPNELPEEWRNYRVLPKPVDRNALASTICEFDLRPRAR
jgi:DNA-binding response OmpR family regulator